jgi:VIT1/CCC1 family predicted Fe2+/Mn2+ transporter
MAINSYLRLSFLMNGVSNRKPYLRAKKLESTKDRLTINIKNKMVTIDNYLDNHYIHRSNWLRAAVLGANDGIISVSSLAIGVAAASSTREPIVLATVAGLVAGALSMAAGEYVSVSSQTDTEKADIEREAQELKEMPEQELKILAQIYEKRGLKKETAMQVAIEFTEKDALGAHIRDELGINEISQANPIQAAIASGASFTVGGVLPLLVILFAPVKGMEYWLYGFTTIFLIILGTTAAKAGGSSVIKAIMRITIWGTIAMGLSALVGYIFGVKI